MSTSTSIHSNATQTHTQTAHPAASALPAAPPSRGLLDAIRSFHASVGGCLNEDELTWLLRAEQLPAEEGFTFLGLSDGCATFSVPKQDPSTWYRERGWLSAQKEAIGKSIGQKYGLHLYEPPDASSTFRFPVSDSLEIHHHLALGNAWETLIIAHPRYLKIRLFCSETSSRHLSDATLEELLGPSVLRDVAALYVR